MIVGWTSYDQRPESLMAACPCRAGVRAEPGTAVLVVSPWHMISYVPVLVARGWRNAPVGTSVAASLDHDMRGDHHRHEAHAVQQRGAPRGASKPPTQKAT